MNNLTRLIDTTTVANIVLAIALVYSVAGNTTRCVAEEPESPACFSGIYPHLAYFNPHGECGTGAVVPWAGKLWVITYGPHYPEGSQDKLYEITSDLSISEFEDSVGGTPANRMIHRPTNQLLIGPYVINEEGNVRVITPEMMRGRLTGTAAHLFEPERKVYYATMEEGIYAVDLETLEVTEHFADYQQQTGHSHGNRPVDGRAIANLPGYHGKGLFSGQGRLIYANNGDAAPEAKRRPDVPSGCLAEWDGESEQWKVILRNQFTDIRGPGGIYGNDNPETDPVWAIGWDHKSLLLLLLDDGQWYTYRLPKASHCYDGAHGWNTEWPRIHDIGEEDMVMNMHGMFWRFPRTFSRQDSAGIGPRSTYLKVIGDYCVWNDRLVFGCDDTAKNEFLNTRRAKGELVSPGISHSNLWFTDRGILDELGPPLGRGSVWLNESVGAGEASDPFLLSEFDHKTLFLTCSTNISLDLEVDFEGNNEWELSHEVTLVAGTPQWIDLSSTDGEWIRVRSRDVGENVTAQFQYSSNDERMVNADSMFDGIAGAGSTDVNGGIVRVRGADLRTLALVTTNHSGDSSTVHTFYELDAEMNLSQVDDAAGLQWSLEQSAIPEDILEADSASVIYVDDDGNRWRLPKGAAAFDEDGAMGPCRVDREVVTERDLFNAHGTFYELPARNAGGFPKIRPICTHNRRIKDYCSYRGMLIISGIENGASADNPHIIRSDDGQAALWAGVVDDLWKFGKPVGTGGPWQDSGVSAGEASDPYLMTGYDQKSLELSHTSDSTVSITAEVDISGSGDWVEYQTFEVPAGEVTSHEFPAAFNAYWIRFSTDADTTASAILTYR
ncbi:MAG: hypothetical protein AAF456_01480 [Planctomycetota bacterium]